MTKSRNIRAPRLRWTEAELAHLRQHYPHRRTDEVAHEIGRSYGCTAGKAASLGLRKSAAYLASPEAHRLDGKRGSGTRFQAGHTSWNKGTKGLVGVQEACRANHFKPGRPACEARNYRPIGSLRINGGGYLERKVTDEPTLVPARRWVAEHRLVWEAANGPMPAGHVVVFREGRRTTDIEKLTLDAVELVSRKELMSRNTLHNMPKPLAELVQLRGVLTRQINRKAKEAETT
jgi:hypothetical protein